jgi:uncharacterized protein (TIGR02284 family)
MVMDNDELISVLNNLIEICKDGQLGFKEAAEGIEDSSIKNLLLQYSQQRAQFSGELQNEVNHLGGNPETSGSVAGAMHRGWFNIKSAVTGKDTHAILAECERGEDSAVSTYRKALEKPLPANIADIVRRQYVAIQEAHNRMKSLRDSTDTSRHATTRG